MNEFNQPICYCYGNCQAKLLNIFLQDHPVLKNKYQFHYYYIGNSITTINIDLLRKTQLFIYQYVKDTTLPHDDALYLDSKQYTVEYIKQNYLPKTCISISFPSIFFDAYWPYMGFLSDAHSMHKNEFFDGYVQNKLYELVQNANLSETDILNKVDDSHFIFDFDMNLCYENSCKNLQIREQVNKVDIPLSSYLIENFKKIQLMNTLNHPTVHVFNYLINKINELLKLEYTDYLLKDTKYNNFCDATYKIPIFPCIVRHFGLENCNIGPFYVLTKPFQTRQDFYLYFIRKIRN